MPRNLRTVPRFPDMTHTWHLRRPPLPCLPCCQPRFAGRVPVADTLEDSATTLDNTSFPHATSSLVSAIWSQASFKKLNRQVSRAHPTCTDERSDVFQNLVRHWLFAVDSSKHTQANLEHMPNFVPPSTACCVIAQRRTWSVNTCGRPKESTS